MPVKDEHKKTLEQHSQGNKFIYSSYDNVTQEMVQEANVIIGNVDPFYLQEAKNLECCSNVFLCSSFTGITTRMFLSFFIELLNILLFILYYCNARVIERKPIEIKFQEFSKNNSYRQILYTCRIIRIIQK